MVNSLYVNVNFLVCSLSWKIEHRSFIKFSKFVNSKCIFTNKNI